MINQLEISTKAQELRELLGEDANSPVDIFSLANQINDLTIVNYPMSDHISGMCVIDEKVRLIAINSTMSYGRQRFSLAHELYHLFYDESTGFNVCARGFDSKSEVERSANQFATYFLAPYKSFREMIRKACGGKVSSLEQIIEMEQYFGMSHQATLWRLVSEGYLAKADIEEYSYGVMSAARTLGYADRLYKPSPDNLQKRTYGHYLKQVEGLRQRELVSQGKIDELLLDAFRADIAYGDDDEGREIID